MRMQKGKKLSEMVKTPSKRKKRTKINTSVKIHKTSQKQNKKKTKNKAVKVNITPKEQCKWKCPCESE